MAGTCRVRPSAFARSPLMHTKQPIQMACQHAVGSGYGLESVWQDMTAGISCIRLLKLASQDVAPRTPLSLTQNQPAAQDRDLAREFDIHRLPRLQVPERIGQRPQIGCLDAGENQKPVARFEPGLLGA